MPFRQASFEPRLAAVGLVCIVVVAALGILYELGLVGNTFNLDGEFRPPAIVSAGLLAIAGALAIASAAEHGRADRRAFLGIGAFLLFMAADELLMVHERLEMALNVDWMVLYGVLFVVAAICGLMTLRAMPARRARALLLLGASAWFLSQVLEAQQWSGDTKNAGYAPMMVTEELLEMLGSLFFALAFANALRSRDPERAGTGRAFAPRVQSP